MIFSSPQDSLVIEAAQEARGAVAHRLTDLRQIELPVLAASAEECAAHEAALGDIDTASGGKAVWRVAAPA